MAVMVAMNPITPGAARCRHAASRIAKVIKREGRYKTVCRRTTAISRLTDAGPASSALADQTAGGHPLRGRWHEEWACEGWLMGTSQPVWPVLRNGRYMMPAHKMSTELVAYLSLPCIRTTAQRIEIAR